MRVSTPLLLVTLALTGCKDGPPGPSGPDGADGVNGVDGVDGLDGTDGVQSQRIEADTTWSGEVTLSGPVEIVDGVTVTVQAGTTLQLAPETRLTVRGQLNFEGTDESRIVVQNTVAKAEAEIIYLASSGHSTLSHTVLNNTELTLEGDNATQLTGVTFTESAVTIYGQTSPLTLENCSFNGLENSSEVLLSITASTGVTVRGSHFDNGNKGISFQAGQDGDTLTIEGSVFTNQTYAVRSGDTTHAQGVVAVSNSEIVGSKDYAVLGYNTVITLQQTNILDALGTGIYGDHKSSIVLIDTSLSNVGKGCVRAYGLGDEPLVVVNSTLVACGSDGIDATHDVSISGTTLVDIGGNCIDIAKHGLVLESSVLSNCGADGIEATYDVTVTNSVIETTGGYGLDVQELFMDQTTVMNATDEGVYVRGTEISWVKNSNIENNGGIGVRGNPSGVNMLDVVNSNIVGNAEKALSEVQVAQGNYIADNNGVTGVDTTEAGTLDGTRNTDSDQINDADVVETPALERITSAGGPE